MGTYTPVLEQMNPKTFRRFWRFVNERQLVWRRRFVDKEKAPWTDNPTLQEFQFTNVFRELDRGTLWLTENITSLDDKYLPPKEKLFNIILYRLFNHIPTYEFLYKDSAGKLIPPHHNEWKWKAQAKALRKWREEGHQVFTSAFTVTGAAFAGSSNKIDNICYLVHEINHFLYKLGWWDAIWNAPTMEEAWKQLRKVRGFGPFLAYEIVIDINYAHRRWGEDKFVNPGPGAKRGINAIYPDINRVPDYVLAMEHLQSVQRKMLPTGFPYTKDVPKLMSKRNIEHSLCEFQKYEKRRKGIRTGRARSFTPNKQPLPGRKKKG